MHPQQKPFQPISFFSRQYDFVRKVVSNSLTLHTSTSIEMFIFLSLFSDFFLGKCHLDIIKDWKEDETTHGIIWSPNVYESGRVFGGAYQIRVPFLQFFEWVRSLFVQSVQQGENREWTREKGREGGRYWYINCTELKNQSGTYFPHACTRKLVSFSVTSFNFCYSS